MDTTKALPATGVGPSMFAVWFRIVACEALAQWIVEPFCPRKVSRDEHLNDVRAYVRALDAIHTQNHS